MVNDLETLISKEPTYKKISKVKSAIPIDLDILAFDITDNYEGNKEAKK